MNELQKCLLDMVEWFHEFCTEKNLRYYLVGGSMLGAVRHKGFIPWDDDIDVAMPRKDYDLFLQYMSKQIINNYCVESNDSDAPEYLYVYSKVYNINTTLIENYKKPVRRGVYLDVFPLDGIGNSIDEVERNYKPIIKQYNFLQTRACKLRKGRAWYKNLAVILSRMIPEKIVDNKLLTCRIDELCRRYDYDNSLYVGNLLGNWGAREIMKRSIYGNPQKYQFENITLFGVEDYDTYLTNMYGDYMILPPPEKRITHHDFLELDLKKPYMNISPSVKEDV